MNQLATITSKRQLTIPAAIFRKAGLAEGQKVLISLEKGSLRVESSLALVKRLSGSVEVPLRFKGKKIGQIIALAKKERFTNG